MVHHHRASLLQHHNQVQRKGDAADEEEQAEELGGGRMKELRGRLVDYACHHRKHGHDALLLMLAGFAFVSCLLLLLPGSPFSAAMDDLLQLGRTRRCDQEMAPAPPAPCAGALNGTVCCDRTSPRADLCVMRGDVRTHAASNSLFLLAATGPADERIRPYTRKWESSVMSTIDELRLRAVPVTEGAAAASAVPARCDVQHDVPAVVFSTGGYTGNVYHEFNDGIIPLYITGNVYQEFDGVWPMRRLFFFPKLTLSCSRKKQRHELGTNSD